MAIESVLVLAAAGIILFLAMAHLVYTFWGPKLRPREATTTQAMKDSSLGITRDTTVWDAWVGFNASHSFGAILFSIVFGYLSARHPGVLFGSGYLMVAGGVYLLLMAALAYRYWFRTPFVGISVALACYAGGALVSLLE